MSAELQARIKLPNADVEEDPTDGSNLAQRTPLLSSWINAYALIGGPVQESATGNPQSAFREFVDSIKSAANRISRRIA